MEAKYYPFRLLLLPLFALQCLGLPGQSEGLDDFLETTSEDPNILARMLYKELKSHAFSRNSEQYDSLIWKAYQYTQHPDFSDDTLKVDITMNMGNTYFFKDHASEDAVYYFKEALKLAKDLGDQRRTARLYSNIGNSYLYCNEYAKAIDCQLQSKEVASVLKDSVAIFSAAINAGLVYLKIKEYEKAQGLFEEGYQIAHSLGKEIGMMVSRLNLADVLVEKQRYDLAGEYYDEAIALARNKDLKMYMANAYSQKGWMLFKQGRYDSARIFAAQGEELSRMAKSKDNLLLSSMLLAKLDDRSGKLDAAMRRLRELRELLGEKSQEMTAEYYGLMADLQAKKGHYEAAYQAARKYDEAQAKLYDDNKIREFARIESQYQFEARERENLFLKEQAALQAKLLNQRTVMAVLGLSGAGLLTLLSILLYHKNKKEAKVNQKLEQKVSQRTRHLLQANRNLQEANQELGRFAFIASHDLREPLRNIVSFCNLARTKIRKGDYMQVGEYLDFVERGGRQMFGLLSDIENFFSVSQSEVDKKEPLHKILETAQKELSPLLERRNATYKAWICPGIENNAFPQILEIVFRNLLENAVKYNNGDNPFVQITGDFSEGNYVFTVSDNGQGISPDYQEKVFEMFCRLHGRDKHSGSGLGLAICEKAIRRLGGAISIRKSDQNGTTFEFILPAEVAQQTAVAKVKPIRKKGMGKVNAL